MSISSHEISADVGRPQLAARQGFYSLYGKQIVDVGLVVLMLPLMLPLLAVIWLILTLSGGQAIYAQDRVGRGGELFRCYKFRSMVPNAELVLKELCAADAAVAAEWNTYQKLRHDPRITRLGRVIRKTSVDELPQLFNVLKGDMSLVGPRPFMCDQEELYRQAGGQAYYYLRPGITGEWQVQGRGQSSFAARVGYDNRYGQSLSVARDLALLVRTARVLLNRTGQ